MKSGQFDYILFFSVVILLILSNLILAPLSAPFSFKRFGTTNYFVIHQIVYGLLPGLALGLFFYKIPLGFLKKISPFLFLINIIFLIFVFLPFIGSRLQGANRWLSIGGVTFQPSEFLKLSVILFLSGWLKNISADQTMTKKYLLKTRKKNYNLRSSLIPFLVISGFISLIFILQPDISTLTIIALVSLILYFAIGTPFWHSILIVLAGAGGLIALINISSYRFSRLLAFLKPEIDPMGIGYQVKQALIAVGSGGFWGRGIGTSIQKFGFLPHPMSDSIFAVYAEETGLAGAIVLISLFLVFLWRGLKISKATSDKFCQLAAIGISSWVVIQAFFNIGSIVGILPLAGIPLPFISYGGSHLVTELAAVGILLNISKHKNP